MRISAAAQARVVGNRALPSGDFLRHAYPHSPGSRSKRRICPIALDVVRFILENDPAKARTSKRPGQNRRVPACRFGRYARRRWRGPASGRRARAGGKKGISHAPFINYDEIPAAVRARSAKVEPGFAKRSCEIKDPRARRGC